MATLKEEIVELRRYFHRYPELATQEKNTSQKIAQVMKDKGLLVKENVGGYGVVGLLEANKTGRTIAIRADMDALPITEKNDIEYKSQNLGVMHACGHDCHMAIVLGAVMLLSEQKDNLKGNIKFIFQPAEEKPPGGAKFMIEEGVLENPSVDIILSLHNSPDFPVGTIMVPEGAIMAGSDVFKLKIKGIGGHGARPEKCEDVILIASNFVIMLQNVINRKFSPNQRPVISVGRIEGGTEHNIIPKEVNLLGTIRYFNKEKGKIRHEMESILDSLTSIYGGCYELNYSYGYPITINNHLLTKHVRKTASDIKDINNIVTQLDVAYVSDDFGYFSQLLPACYIMFGVGNKEKGIVNPLHTPRYDLDEEAMPIISELLAKSVIDYLNTI